MKKIILISIMLLLSFTLIACGSDEAEPSKPAISQPQQEEASDEESNESSIEVDKSLLNVEITLPELFIELEDMEQVIADAKADGVNITINDNGSLTYKMSKSTHQQMMKDIEIGMIENIEEIINDYQSVKDITHNKSFSQFTLVVDKGAFENSLDGFAAFTVGVLGTYYQAFYGVNVDDNKVAINFENMNTGEVFDTATFPDDLTVNANGNQ